MKLSSAAAVSISKLSSLDERIHNLRQKLRDGFLNHSPFLEVAIFTELVGIIENQLRPCIENQTDSTSSEVIEARQLISRYLQDVLASALYLIDEEGLEAMHVSINSLPQCPPSSSNFSVFYVSALQRRYCAEVFFYLCWCKWLPAHVVVHALYPLLDTVNSGGVPSLRSYDPSKMEWKKDPKLQNQIAVNLLAKHRAKKVILTSTLNGIVLTRQRGIASLLRTLLLNDRVEAGMAAEASGYIVKLLLSPMRSMWTYDSSNGAVQERTLTYEDQMIFVSQQMVLLFEEHAEELHDASSEPSAAPPLLKQLALARHALPPETVEERLHLCLTRWLNASLSLRPAPHGVSRPEAYRRLGGLNRHFLTPAFGALARGGRPVGEGEKREGEGEGEAALSALRRVLTVANGTAAGAAAESLLAVLPAVAGGLLRQTARARAGVEATVCRALWQRIAQLRGPAEAVARLLVRAVAAAEEVGGAHATVANRVEAARRGSTALDCPTTVGLRRVLGLATEGYETSEELSRCCFAALVEECIARLYGSTITDVQGEGEWPRSIAAPTETQAPLQASDSAFLLDDAVPPAATDYPLLSILEDACLTWPADRIFGSQTSLEGTLSLLSKTLQLSEITAEWSLTLLHSLLKDEEIFRHMENQIEHLNVDETQSLASKRLSILQVRERLFTLKGVLQQIKMDGLFVCKTFQQQADGVDRIETVLRALGNRLEEMSLRESALLQMLDNDKGGAAAARDRDSFRVKCKALCSDLSDALLASQSAVIIDVILARLSSSIEDATLTVKNVDDAFCETCCQVVRVLIKILYTYNDACVSVHAIRCLTWIGMHRFDSCKNTVLGGYFCEILSLSAKTPLTAALCSLLGISSSKKREVASVKLSQLKLRVLDVLLSWCDYDEGGLTLRNVDQVCSQARKCSLFDLLADLCRPPEETVSQVAALHLIGCYAVTASPRVSLRRVLQLAVDVFRHTPVMMAKAACASMLAHIASTLSSQCALTTLQDVDMEELLSIARAMETYHSPHKLCSSGYELLHEEVVRKHGWDIVKLLQGSAQQVLISELPL